MIKALIKKELRENVKVALLGLVVYAVLLSSAYQTSILSVASLAIGSNATDSVQPLLAPSFLDGSAFFCAIFGAVLGWLQYHAESHPDRRAFLIHRPITRTRIFGCKVSAGLFLYVLAVGLPLFGLVAAVRSPGHIAAPFEWAMILPATGRFLTGIVFYFAGMLTGLRQARWYASRGLGLAAAVMVSFAVVLLPENWQGLVVILIVGPVLAVAAWGSFLSLGHYQGQPALGRLGLTAGIMFGGSVVCVAVFGFLISILLPANQPQSYSYYQMGKEGTIYKQVQGGGGPPRFFDLNGVPLKDDKTGLELEQREFYRLLAASASVNVEFGNRAPIAYQYYPSSRFFTLWRLDNGTLWYWNRDGHLLAYDVRTRRFAGTLEPKDGNPLASAQDNRFSRPQNSYSSLDHQGTLATPTAAYQVDVRNRTVNRLFTTAADDPIGGIASAPLDHDAVVVTRRFIHLVGADGGLLWKAPYEPAYPDYSVIQINFLADPDRLVLWIKPSYAASLKAGWTLPIHVRWISRDQGNLKTSELPALAYPSAGAQDRLMSLLAPPEFSFWIAARLRAEGVTPPQRLGMINLVVSLMVVLAGWLLGRRHSFSARSQFGWAVFHLLSGVPGLLAFVCVQEWPAREPCPKCGKPRVVDREQCEHCGAEFAPPARNGTEIFAQEVSS